MIFFKESNQFIKASSRNIPRSRCLLSVMNTTNILERNISKQSYVPDRRSSGNRQIPPSEDDSPIYHGDPAPVDADIVIPVYNEETQLADSVSTLCSFLDRHSRDLTPFSWNIVIADNASTDASWQIAMSLCDWCPNQVRALHLARKGRGYALKQAWQLQGGSRRIYGCGSIHRHRLYGQPYSSPAPGRGRHRLWLASYAAVSGHPLPPNVNSFRAPTISCSAHIWLSPFMMPSAVSRPSLLKLRMPCCLR